MLLGWRDTPTDNSVLSEAVREIEPFVRQVFIGRGNNCKDTNAFERKLAFKGVGVFAIVPAADKNLTDKRFDLSHSLAKYRIVSRRVAPT